MNWKPGDIAIVEDSVRSRAAGRFVILRRLYQHPETGNDFVYGKRIIPKAWIVDMIAPGELDGTLLSEFALIPVDHPNRKTCWSECPWQPLEYAKYP